MEKRKNWDLLKILLLITHPFPDVFPLGEKRYPLVGTFGEGKGVV